MSLIVCPECGAKISDTAKHCIKCGYREKEKGIVKFFLFSILIMYALSYLFFGAIILYTISIYLAIESIKQSKKKLTEIISLILMITSMVLLGLTIINFVDIITESGSKQFDLIVFFGGVYWIYLVSIIYLLINRIISGSDILNVIAKGFLYLIAPWIIVIFVNLILEIGAPFVETLLKGVATGAVLYLFSKLIDKLDIKLW